MIRTLGLVIWIALILATALTLQVVANWVLSAGLALYVSWRWRGRQRRTSVASQALEPPIASTVDRRTRWH